MGQLGPEQRGVPWTDLLLPSWQAQRRSPKLVQALAQHGWREVGGRLPGWVQAWGSTFL